MWRCWHTTFVSVCLVKIHIPSTCCNPWWNKQTQRVPSKMCWQCADKGDGSSRMAVTFWDHYHRGIEGVVVWRTEGQDYLYCSLSFCFLHCWFRFKGSPPQSKIHRHLHNMSIYLFIYLYIHIYIFCTRIAQWKGTRRSEKGLGAGNKIVKVEGPTFIIERWEDMGSLKMTPASTPGSRSSQGFPKSPDDSHAMAAKLVRILSFSPVVACVCPALRLMHILYKLDPVETRCSLGDV